MDYPSVPSHHSIQALATKNSQDLQRSNKHNGVDIGNSKSKAEFQAIWALWRLGILVKDKELSTYGELFEKTTGWCADNVAVLKEAVLDRQLQAVDETRWMLVESLIRDEYKVLYNPKPKGNSKRKSMMPPSNSDTKKRKFASMKAVKVSTSTEFAEKRDTADQEEEVDACVVISAIESIEVDEHLSTDEVAIPHHTVLNLLLTAIHLNVSISNKPDQILGCPELKIDNVKQVLDNIPSFKHGDALTQFLLKPLNDERAILSDICVKYGDILKPATGDMKLPSFPKSVHQFVLTRQLPNSNPQLGDYKVVFHGTPMHFLHSILHEGLKVAPADKLIWTATDPLASFYYAANGGERTGFSKPAFGWKNSQGGNGGILLVCQGNLRGQTVGNGHAEVFRNAADIIVRYVLVLPTSFCQQGQSSVTRAAIEPVIRKAIDKMTAERIGLASSEGRSSSGV